MILVCHDTMGQWRTMQAAFISQHHCHWGTYFCHEHPMFYLEWWSEVLKQEFWERLLLSWNSCELAERLYCMFSVGTKNPILEAFTATSLGSDRIHGRPGCSSSKDTSHSVTWILAFPVLSWPCHLNRRPRCIMACDSHVNQVL